MIIRKIFTEEELKEIRTNPYVKSATANKIHYTLEFKEEFWRRYNEKKQNPRKIMEDLGFNVEIIGMRRIDGIRFHIQKEANSSEGFKEAGKTKKKELSGNKRTPPSVAISKMETKIAYMEQELEFIKKTIMADNTARQKK